MRIDFTDEDKEFAKKETETRQKANRKKLKEDPKASSKYSGPYLEERGVFGELAVAKGFNLDREQMHRPEAGWDPEKLDFVCPSGHTIQVKCPTRPGLNLMMTVNRDVAELKADFGVLVDLYDNEYAIIHGWITSKRFEALKFVQPNCERDNRTVKRESLVTVGNKIPVWVTERIEEFSKCGKVK